jgi:hypothetical protein
MKVENLVKGKVSTWDMASLERPGFASFHAFMFALTNTWDADGFAFRFIFFVCTRVTITGKISKGQRTYLRR